MNKQFELYLDIQNTISSDGCGDLEHCIPEKSLIESWIRQAISTELLQEKNKHQRANNEYELTLRIVNKDEIQSLNKSYRHKDRTTNILSFPYESFSFDMPEELQLPLLGDLVICHDIVVEEALQQGKSVAAHWAHMVVHGVLHLKGYDHINNEEALEMEALEIEILKYFAISDPYE